MSEIKDLKSILMITNGMVHKISANQFEARYMEHQVGRRIGKVKTIFNTHDTYPLKIIINGESMKTEHVFIYPNTIEEAYAVHELVGTAYLKIIEEANAVVLTTIPFDRQASTSLHTLSLNEPIKEAAFKLGINLDQYQVEEGKELLMQA